MRRLIEIAIPLSAWLLITMPLWLSFWHPALVAYIIITFDIYWFYKSFSLAYFAIRSYLTMQAHIKVDWVSEAKKIKRFSKLYHVVIVPEYKEPIHILRRTLDSLTLQDFPKKRIIVVLATEKRMINKRKRPVFCRRNTGKNLGNLLSQSTPCSRVKWQENPLIWHMRGRPS